MPEILEDIAYLSQEIGPRPAGTEEEQQAAAYIAEQFKNRVGIRAQTEEFACSSNAELVDLVLCALPIVFSLLAMIRTLFVVPSILVCLACAALFALEITGRPVISRLFQRGVSQNVVAKYRPEGVRNKRSRKIVVVAHYDSGKIRNELLLGRLLGLVQQVSAIALLSLPFVWIIRSLFAMGASGAPLVVWNVITCILMLLAAIPVILYFVHYAAQYNEAANSNAAGVAALIELANRINNTIPEDNTEAEIHGEEAAREAGLIPDGVVVDYGAQATVEEPQSEEDRLLAAKAAVEALTGKPLREYAPASDGSDSLVSSVSSTNAYEEDISSNVAIESDVQEPAVDGEVKVEFEDVASEESPSVFPVAQAELTSIPEWYRKAQDKADKSHQNDAPVKRSRYASALDEAVAASSSFFDAANRVVGREESVIERQFDGGITEVPAPMDTSSDVHQSTVMPAHETIQDTTRPSPNQDEAIPSSPSTQGAQNEAIDGRPPLAADFMVEHPSMPQQAKEGQTAPILPVEPDRAEEMKAGSTTVMEPIDVSELRASLGDSLTDSARRLQARPSRNIDHAPRRDVERVTYSATDEVSAAPAPPDGQLPSPDVAADLPPVDELRKQRAPLAEAGNPSLSSQIPRINLDAFGVSTSGNAEPLDNKRAALQSMLPSMSGSITLEPDSVPESNSTVSLTGAFAPVGVSSGIGPVGDELVEGVDPDELYVDDADDSFSETVYTETGAYAGPGYMEMPEESPIPRFLSRFRRKKNKDVSRDGSAQEWLGVEDDFNPTEVGAARGGWDSFANDDRGRVNSNRRHVDRSGDDEEWNGGAFSKIRAAVPIPGKKDAPARTRAARSVPAKRTENREVQAELDQISAFYSKKMELDVWFVALGSEFSGNAGMKAFLNEHAGELRGSIIVNLDSLGAGTFSYIDSEGSILQKSPSTRLRRYIRRAQQATGVSISEAEINWKDSAASVAMKHGLQGISLAGMDDCKPAMMAQGDDVVENVDADLLYDHIDFVEAMVRSI